MTHRRPRTILLAALLGATASVGVIAPPAPAAPTQTDPAGGDPPSITLVGRSPWVAPDGTIELDIAGEGDVDTTILRVRIHGPVESVEDLERSQEEDVGRVLHRSPPVAVGFIAVAADGSRPVRVPTSVGTGDTLTAQLREPGVYPLVLTIEDESGVVSEIRTPVIRLGTEDDPLPAPRIELVVDVSAPPTIEPDGRRELDDDELARLDRLRGLIDGTGLADPTGRLPAPGPIDVTLAASPDTLDALTASSDPRAGAVLDAVSDTRADRNLLGLPTVPLSAPALVDSDLGLFLVALLENGRSTLNDRIDAAVEVDTSVWDATDGIDDTSAALLAGAGLEHVLFDAPSAALDNPALDNPAAERKLIDAGPYRVDEILPMEALLVDRATSRGLRARASDRADAGHLALAELVVRDDGQSSSVVVRVDDAPDDSLLIPTLALLTAPGSPVGVGPLTTGTPPRDPDDETGIDTSPIGEIELPESSTDLTAVARRVGAVTRAIESFGSLVGAESARADALNLQVATSLASRLDDNRRRELLDTAEDAVDEAFDAVSLTGQTDLNLTSRSGTLPLQIHNGNDFPVVVVLEISSDRLRFPEGERFEITATEEITRVDVPVQAQATGSVPTFVTLTTPDGLVDLDERQLDVRSTAISGVGLALSLGALLVLVIWWARTWRRSRPVDPRRPARVG